MRMIGRGGGRFHCGLLTVFRGAGNGAGWRIAGGGRLPQICALFANAADDVIKRLLMIACGITLGATVGLAFVFGARRTERN